MLALLRTFAVLAILAAAPAAAQTPAPPATPAAPAKEKPAPAPAAAPPAPEAAQHPPAPPPADLARAGEDLERANAVLNEIESALDNHSLSDTALAAMREKLTPATATIGTTIEKSTPRLAEMKARLDQLGAPAAPDAPPESPTVTAERAAQSQSFSVADELVKRAKLMTVRAGQLRTTLASRRRQLFARSLLQRSASPADLGLWRDVLSETPANLRDAGGLFHDGIERINARFDGWRRVAFWLALPAAFLVYFPVTRLAIRIFARRNEVEAPSQLLKVLGAWWIALVIAIPPTLLTYLAILALNAANLTPSRLEPFVAAIAFGVLRVTVIAGLSRGLFAPTRPKWRLPPVSDAAAARFVGVAVAVAAILSATRAFEALNEAVDASLSCSVATRSVGAILGAVALGAGLWRLGADAPDEDCFGPPVRGRFNWFGLLHSAALIAALIIIAAALFGYPALASFLLDQVLWISVVVMLGVMLGALINESVTAGFKPQARFGAMLVTRVGIRRTSIEVIGVVLSGILRVILFFVVVAAVLVPWGLQTTDVSLDLQSAFFGFRIADVTISPATIVGAAIVFTLVWGAMHVLQRWLDSQVLPQTGLDAGLRNSIVTSLRYLGFLLAVSFALGYFGLSFERLAIVAGALSVGIGFGLQSIVNNFVSGLILLWERAVRVGDWIAVGGDQGFVRRINVRSTEIETVDRAQVIIPNSSLISGVVKNMVRNDRTGRVVIPVTVSSSASPEAVRETLFAIARANDRVLKMPAPQIFFTGMSASSLTFELAALVVDVETMARVRSDLHFEIFKQFKERKFFDGPAAAPQQIEILGALQAFAQQPPPPEPGAAVTGTSRS